MSSYYQKLESLVTTNIIDHIPTCLIKLLLTYIIYPSRSFNEWINDEQNIKYKEALDHVRYRSCPHDSSVINKNYGTKDYLLGLPDKIIYKKFDLEQINEVFDSWYNRELNTHDYFILFRYSDNKFVLMRMRKYIAYIYDNVYSTDLIMADSIENIYIHHNTVSWVRKSKIKVVNGDDCGLLSICFDKMKDYRIDLKDNIAINTEDKVNKEDGNKEDGNKEIITDIYSYIVDIISKSGDYIIKSSAKFNNQINTESVGELKTNSVGEINKESIGESIDRLYYFILYNDNSFRSEFILKLKSCEWILFTRKRELSLHYSLCSAVFSLIDNVNFFRYQLGLFTGVNVVC